jgi:hypothetical protein
MAVKTRGASGGSASRNPLSPNTAHSLIRRRVKVARPKARQALMMRVSSLRRMTTRVA